MADNPFTTFPPQLHSTTGKITAKTFVQWVASLGDTAEEVFVREISWVKEPHFPSHEYILLTFSDNSHPNTSDDTTLRLERDTDSWFKIFGSWFRSNCKDTVSISSTSLTAQHSGDRTIACITVNRTDIDLRYIALLLEVVRMAADEYKI
ncbi:hypothetical protein JAAARDRAFT_31157 [Jaapia argillacea MUCL 33604]|uniref:Uncharacterized protein n=1 Tax=Jaapia argillacea MUCL 33604 TaxID=933084 RepID=A0A067QDW5_9AGAM|nr:hypothetical protein JAAARDRAFT_31157 [Jaapia argillacea MUCL 33604]